MADTSGSELTDVHGRLREHELELNRATAVFEHAAIAPLTLVNGGAAAAWLTFVAARSDSSSSDINVDQMTRAAIPWVVGLLLAVAAAFIGWRRQQAYAYSERQRREAFEWLWLNKGRPESSKGGPESSKAGPETDMAAVLQVLTNEDFKAKYDAKIEKVRSAKRRERSAVAAEQAGTQQWLAARLLAAVSAKTGSRYSAWFQSAIVGSGLTFALGAFCAGLSIS